MNFKEQKSIYQQIAERICDSILADQYPEGGRIPSVRELAGQLEVNVNTAVKSYDSLATQDILYNQRGLGYFVSKGAKGRIKAMRRKEFIKDFLPELFERMEQLGISLGEIEELYKKQHN